METLIHRIAELRKEGYSDDFSFKDGKCMISQNTGEALSCQTEELILDKIYRFDHGSDPGEQAMLYAISCPDRKIRGLMVNGYGIYSDEKTNKAITLLEDNHQRAGRQ